MHHAKAQISKVSVENTEGNKIMKNTKLILATMALALSCGMGSTFAQTKVPGPGDPNPDADLDRDRDRLQECSPELEQQRARVHQTLPEPVKDAVQDMAQAREKYQQQQQAMNKDQVGTTKEECDQVREQLREQLQEQARDREQIRERLQELRECLQDQQQLMDQAREQTQERRRGE